MTTQKTELVLATEIKPAVLFGNEHGTLEDLLNAIKKEVSSIAPDVTTAKGRKEITANVSRITKSKTTLDKVGKDYNAAQKELLKSFDKQRKYAFTFLEDLQKEVRKPLTEWEDKEKDRIAKNESVISAFILDGEASENWMNYTVEELNNLLANVEGVTITKRLQEFEEEANIAKIAATKKINEAIQSRTKYDEDQAELKKLREESAEADRLRYEADQKAKAERAAQQKVIDANAEKEAAIKKAKLEQEAAENREKKAKVQTELDLKEAEKQRIIDAENAEKQRVIDVEAAAQAERDRIEQEKLKEEREAAAREANKSHKGKINRAAVKAIIESSKAFDTGENVITEGQAKLIIKIIANNKIPNIKISY